MFTSKDGVFTTNIPIHFLTQNETYPIFSDGKVIASIYLQEDLSTFQRPNPIKVVLEINNAIVSIIEYQPHKLIPLLDILHDIDAAFKFINRIGKDNLSKYLHLEDELFMKAAYDALYPYQRLKKSPFDAAIDFLLYCNLPIPVQECEICKNNIYRLGNNFKCPKCGCRTTAYGGTFPLIATNVKLYEDDVWHISCSFSDKIIGTFARLTV